MYLPASEVVVLLWLLCTKDPTKATFFIRETNTVGKLIGISLFLQKRAKRGIIRLQALSVFFPAMSANPIKR